MAKNRVKTDFRESTGVNGIFVGVKSNSIFKLADLEDPKERQEAMRNLCLCHVRKRMTSFGMFSTATSG